MRKCTLILSLLMLFAACKKDESAVPDMGYNYFPDQVGHFVIYDVDSMYYDDFSHTVDTFRFQLKEKIQSVFADNTGRSTLRLERFRKYFVDTIPYDSMNWTLTDVWMANKTATQVEKVEENVRFVKLIFPVLRNSSWDGNVANTLGATSYSYLFVDQARTIGAAHFDSVAQVVQTDQQNLIQRKYSTEKFARNTGLVYKQFIDVESQPPSSWAGLPYESDSLSHFYAIPIMQRISAGTQFTYTYHSSGTE